MAATRSKTLKDYLGELPGAPELFWQLRQRGKPLNESSSLAKLEKHLPAWRDAAAQSAPLHRGEGRKLLVFAALRYWVEHTALLSTALAGLGHRVTLAFVPYVNWQVGGNRFDARRQNAYTKKVLSNLSPLVEVVSFLGQKRPVSLPEELQEQVRLASYQDTQYTLQMEEVDTAGELFLLRFERNSECAAAALQWMETNRPDTVILPNGTILEYGAVRLAAEHLGIPVVTYEFGEQRQRIWLAQKGEVMRQDTSDLWRLRKDTPLNEAQWEQVRKLFSARRGASLYENFSRRWQGAPSEGGEKVRQSLGLDARPIALLATNVFGDSLTLGRQVFSRTMGEWLEKTLLYFKDHPEMQLVLRIHPGELIAKGPSAMVLVQQALPHIPENIHVIAPGEKVNTYDIVEIADLGLVYTTTVGMEMAMSGLPVIVAGQTHYRERGFTIDPQTWHDYFKHLDRVIASPASFRLSTQAVEQAWNYAYRFFFEYPHPFPWHLLHFWEDLSQQTMERVLSAEGQAEFGQTFRFLAGDPIEWAMVE